MAISLSRWDSTPTRSPSVRTWARSRSSPLTRATRVALSWPNRSAAVVPAVTDRWLPATETVMSADKDADGDDTVGSCKVDAVCRPAGRRRSVTYARCPAPMLSARRLRPVADASLARRRTQVCSWEGSRPVVRRRVVDVGRGRAGPAGRDRCGAWRRGRRGCCGGRRGEAPDRSWLAGHDLPRPTSTTRLRTTGRLPSQEHTWVRRRARLASATGLRRRADSIGAGHLA